MSINSSLSGNGISFAGLVSGLDTNAIIGALLAADQMPATRDQQRIQQLSQMQAAYKQLGSMVGTFSQASSALNSSTAFSATTANSTDTTVATISAANTSLQGTYNLSITKLAQAQKISSAAQLDTTSALGLSGSFVINGKTVNVATSDSLTTVARSINGTGGSIVASVIDGGSGNAYLSLTSTKTGLVNKVQAADLSGNVLSTLGLISGAATVREAITNGATSFAFASNTSDIQTQLGTSSYPGGSITINGTSVTIAGTDTLQGIADKINGSGAGAAATVRTVTDTKTNVTTYKLDIKNTGGGSPTFVDGGNVLTSLGILQQGYTSELVQAQDAQFTLDNLSLSSASNTVTNILPGVTINLLKGSIGTPGTTTLNVTTDQSAITGKIKAFADAFNQLRDFISVNSQFDTKTNQSGLLLGDSIASQVSSTVNSLLFTQVPGLDPNFNNLTSIGFGLDSSGKITIDDAALGKALATNPTAVQKLFQSAGSSANNAIQYVSSTSKTKSSGVGAYALNITQVATQGSYIGELAQSAPSTASETLTFNGALFGSQDYKLILDVGSTASSTVDKINNDAKLKDLLVASLDGSGKLQIASKRYGTNGNFTAVSNITAGADNSGLGVGSLGTVVAGVDVAGTINGEAATGNGQYLTGAVGNTTTEGLQLLYSGSTTGAVGSLTVTKGVGSLFSDTLGALTDSINGIFAIQDKSITDRISALTDDITRIQADVAKKQKNLQLKFATMESTLSTLQQQSANLSKINSNNN